jgi:phosphopantothenoylcysteine decarboxylase / phosphopantothenate---cysteine ligase
MSPSKFVVIVSGSIAAYKSCELVSLLTKQGHQVRVIMTTSAQKFVGSSSLQALSGHKVYHDDFDDNSFMAHIELGRWCDATIVYPATAQTLNSLAAGVGNELVHSYFLAYDFKKPFLIAPAMNTRMLENPITQNAIQTLSALGCKVLPDQKGTLACGEYGGGRLIEPAQAANILTNSPVQGKQKRKRILITAGGTRETIDGVRTLTNMSTGKTGATIADFLHQQGHQVLLLTSRYAVMPKSEVKTDTFESFQEIYNTLKALGKTQTYDMILHAAAISDYSIEGIQTPEGDILPGQGKMSSEYDQISIKLKRNEKILPRLKDIFHNRPTVVGFKLTSTKSKQEQAKAIFSLFTEDSVDYVVHNDMKDINLGQRRYLMTSREGHQQELGSTEELAAYISLLMQDKPSPMKVVTEEVSHDLMP